MFRLGQTLRMLVLLFCSSTIFSCASVLDPKREFTEPVTGSIIIAKSVLKGDKQKNCDSKPQNAKAACQKQVDALTKSISDAKEKSKLTEEKLD